MKRILDIVLAASALVVLSPVWLVAAWLIWREDPGPLIYKSARVGLGGRDFRMWKFRTMVTNAEKLGGPSTAADDPRLLKSGATLRKFKLDEVPQLVNVLRGDMSLVGPRPEVRMYTDMYSPEERLLLTVRPGMTDWASVRFRNEGEILKGATDPEQAYMERIRPEKIRLGLEYVRQHSIGVDVRIILATVAAVFENRRSQK